MIPISAYIWVQKPMQLVLRVVRTNHMYENHFSQQASFTVQIQSKA